MSSSSTTSTSTSTSSSSSSTSSTYSTTSTFSTTSSSSTTTTTTTTVDYEALTYWPPWISEPKYPIKESDYLPAHHFETEGPYVRTRKKYTSPKLQWEFEWDEKVALPEEEYQALEDFFIAKQGSLFTWTHYSTGVVYTVMFNQDELKGDIVYPGYRSVRVNLIQI